MRTAVGLSLRVRTCEPHLCICGKRVEASGLHAYSCVRNAGMFSRHANLNHPFNLILASIRVPSVIEPAYLYRTDNKRPVDMTIVLWKQGKQGLFNVTVMDALAPRLLSAGPVGNPGVAAAENEER